MIRRNVFTGIKKIDTKILIRIFLCVGSDIIQIYKIFFAIKPFYVFWIKKMEEVE